MFNMTHKEQSKRENGPLVIHVESLDSEVRSHLLRAKDEFVEKFPDSRITSVMGESATYLFEDGFSSGYFAMTLQEKGVQFSLHTVKEYNSLATEGMNAFEEGIHRIFND